jgi:hypothetical protein
MAGSSTNWFTTGGKGASVKGKVFVSNAALMSINAGNPNPPSIAQIKKAFALIQSMGSTVAGPANDQLNALASTPKGAAKAAPKPAPAEALPLPKVWADDPVAQQLIADQQVAGRMSNSGSTGEMAFTDAFRVANPDVPNFINNDYAEQKKEGVTFPAAYRYLADYQGSGYNSLNTNLWRMQRDPVTGAMTSTYGYGVTTNAKSLQKLLLNTVTPIDMTVTRSVSSDHPLAAWAATADVGMPYVSKGFDSSSLNPFNTRGGGDVVMNMRVPAGSHGMYLGATFPENFSYEQEWLLPANSSWVVTGKTILPDGRTEVTVDLVMQQDFAGKVVWPKPVKAKKAAKPKAAPVA